MALFETRKDIQVACDGLKLKPVTMDSESLFLNFLSNNDKERVGFYWNFYYLCAMSESSPVVDFWYCLIGDWMCLYRQYKASGVFAIANSILNINGDYTDEKAYMRRFVGILSVLNKGKNIVLYASNVVFCDMFSCRKSREFPEFIYLCSDLINLQGKKFKSLRHTVNRFKSEHRYEFREYSPLDKSDVLSLYGRWVDDHKVRYPKETIGNQGLLEGILKCSEATSGYKLFICRVDGSLHGFIAVSRLCRDTCSVICEYTDIHLSGLAEMMWYESLKYFPDCTYENDGSGGKDDKDGLYRYKLKHNPVMMLESKEVSFNKKGHKIRSDFLDGKRK